MILDERTQDVLKTTLAQTEVLPRATLLKSLRVLREVCMLGAYVAGLVMPAVPMKAKKVFARTNIFTNIFKLFVYVASW